MNSPTSGQRLPPELEAVLARAAHRLPVLQVKLPQTGRRRPVVAFLLTFLWLGLGHVYAGRRRDGVALAAGGLILLIMTFSGFMALLTIPMWLVLAPSLGLNAQFACARANRDATRQAAGLDGTTGV